MIHEIIGFVLMMPFFVLCIYGIYSIIRDTGFGTILLFIMYIVIAISFMAGLQLLTGWH